VSSKGYTGRTLAVDLTSGRIHERQIDAGTLHRYLGGRGLGIKLLMDMSPPRIDPFSGDNPLIFMTGPYTGVGVFSAFFNITTKAPLTKIAGSSHCGGRWGPKLKRAGFDGVIIQGSAQEPCYLLVEEGKAILRDAGELWGKGVRETEDILT
jgi:aldehyde:ferredoxin oxidoreductase